MTTSASDFDAAKAVAEQLKGMEKERQQRILRWVAESLSLDLGVGPATERRAAETTVGRGATSPHEEPQLLHRHQRPADIKSFVDASAPLAATVMMGGLLEALFVARANLMANKTPLFRAKATPIDSKTKKPLALPEWTLRPYIDVAAELGWISRSGKDVAAVLRDYRNYIHPEKERAHAVSLSDHDSGMFWEVTKSLARQLLASVSTA